MACTKDLESFKVGDQNYFVVDASDGGARWNGKQLTIHLSARGKTLPEIDVNVVFDSKNEVWTGLFHRGAFSQEVTLRRPLQSSGVPAERVVETWVKVSGSISCLHIVKREDGSFGGWSDTLSIPTLMGYANGHTPPERRYQHYGQIFDVDQVGADVYSLEFGNDSGLCCPNKLQAHVSSDGLSLHIDRGAGIDQAAGMESYNRISSLSAGEACVRQSSGGNSEGSAETYDPLPWSVLAVGADRAPLDKPCCSVFCFECMQTD